jgi:hypothetical protein
MKKEICLTEDALKYKNEWVAFSADYQRVVGHGMTMDTAQAPAFRPG